MSIAERGRGTAQVKLCVIYSLSLGAPQDYAEAVKRFRKAADQWHAVAQLVERRC